MTHLSCRYSAIEHSEYTLRKSVSKGREVGDAVAKHIPDTSMEEHGRRDNERVVRLP